MTDPASPAENRSGVLSTRIGPGSLGAARRRSGARAANSRSSPAGAGRVSGTVTVTATTIATVAAPAAAAIHRTADVEAWARSTPSSAQPIVSHESAPTRYVHRTR